MVYAIVYQHGKFAETGNLPPVYSKEGFRMNEGLNSFCFQFTSSYQRLNESVLPIWLSGCNLGLSHLVTLSLLAVSLDMFTLLTILTISSGYVGRSLEFFFKLKEKKINPIKSRNHL